jgi:hypothetical protein
MSNQITQTNNEPMKIQLPLWKDGRNGGMQFCGNWKRLEQEESETFKQIKQTEGFECQDHEYSYKVYKNQYGLSVGRRKMNVTATIEEKPELVKSIDNLTATMNILITLMTASTESERQNIKRQIIT